MKTEAFSIYNASAGSGKTYTLVKQYLKIILTSNKVDAYRNILAITFTNKAVFEMKSRIIDSLFDFSKDNPSQKSIDLMHDLFQDTGLDENQIKLKAQVIIKNIIHNYAAFDISTIDKFTYKIIRTFAHDLGLPSDFDISLDTEKLLQESVDAIIAQAGTDAILTKLLVDFTMEKTDNDKSWDISRDIFDTGKLILNENFREDVLALKDKTIPEFNDLKKNLETLCKQLSTNNIELATQAVALIEEKGISFDSFSRKTFPNHLDFIIHDQLKPTHKKFRQVGDIAINKTAKDKEIIESISEDLIVMLDKIYKNYEKLDFYKAFLTNITPLSLLSTISNKFTALQQEQNILSISEFNQLIADHIQLQPAPFIYERLGERYKHYFIDEFQDTSEMQWKNLIPLIDNALSSESLQQERGSLLLVGDPKQSIYRWRGGKAEQLIELAKKENSPFSNKDVGVHNLEKNYRSFSEVIRFNNDFFSLIAKKFTNTDYKDLYEKNSNQEENTKVGGLVNITFIPEIDTEISEIEIPGEEQENLEENLEKNDVYLKTTLQIIKKVEQEGFLLNEIVLLTRNNNHGVLLAKHLTENNIPVISSESLLLEASSDVQFLINILSYLSNKKEKEALANSLYYLSNNWNNTIPTHDFIWQGIQFKTEIELEQWLQTFGLTISFQENRKKSLYETVENLAHKCIQKSNAYVQYFLDEVLEKEIKYQMSIPDFLEFWKKRAHKISIPSNEESNAIRIMTIHKSKGLEFPVVIFPFAEESYSRNKREKMWLQTEDNSFGFHNFLINKSSKVKNYGDNASVIYDQKIQEDLLDNSNVLYVALTRAVEQLYIVSSIKNKNAKGELPNNLAAYFIEFLENKQLYQENVLNYTFGNSKRVSQLSFKEIKPNYIPDITSIIDPNSIKIAQREALMWGTKQQESIEFGNIMHEILSYIKVASDVDFAIDKALENGLINQNQKNEVYKTITKIVNHTNLKDFFNPNAKIYNEQNIIKNKTKTIKPDRIAILNNKAYLLDYKTGQHQTKYENQLKEYQQALEEMGFEVQKKILLYVGEEIKIIPLN